MPGVRTLLTKDGVCDPPVMCAYMDRFCTPGCAAFLVVEGTEHEGAGMCLRIAADAAHTLAFQVGEIEANMAALKGGAAEH